MSEDVMTEQGRLFIISGPSGVGKGTIVGEIIKASENVSLSVSATTRNPREGEKEGVSYYFMSGEDFRKRIDEEGFLEYAYVHGQYYGTPKAPVEEQLARGKDVILEIDVQGAMQVRDSYGDGTYIFVLPPSLKELRSRINSRGTETPEEVELRMSKAMGEIMYLDRYDYFVINDDLKSAVDTVHSIMAVQHQRIDSKTAVMLEKFRREKL